jgi:chromosome segregation ATPase
MTGDELERAIDFLLKNQARHDARIGQINEQLARNGEQIERNSRQIERNSELMAQQGEQVARQGEQIARNGEQIAQTNAMLREYMEMHSQLVQVVTRTFEAQSRINDSFRAEMKELRDNLVAVQNRADERIDRLAEVVDRHVREGHGGAA